MKDKNIRITRCYLVEYIDKNEKEVESDFCFGTKEDAEKLAMKLKAKPQHLNSAYAM